MRSPYTLSLLAATAVALGYTNHLSAQSIAAGGWHSLSICADSTVKAFGENASGQLGDGSTTDKSTPVTVAGLTKIIAVSGGGDQLEAHSMALKNDGTVWAWGSNIYGGLGNGTTNNSTSPVQASGLSNIVAISAGGWHSVALKNDGTVWTWGWNTDGQLGDGTTTDKSSPVQVSGLTGIIKIATGTYHVLALKNDGTVWAWGDNVSGQIGDGTTTDKTTPVQVSGLTGIVSIASGRFFSLAVKNDGTVWTWGENLYGQLGNNSTVDSSTPVQVSGLSGISSAVAATGAFHCHALKNDGSVWSWGRNTYGNLGDGTLNNSPVPVQMSGFNSPGGMAAGTNFSLFYKNDGTLWGCGRNASGQLGDGTVLQHNTATQAPGTCAILQVVGIAEHSQDIAPQLGAYPNPSRNGKFTLTLDNATYMKSNAQLSVDGYNTTGENVFHASGDALSAEGTIEIDLSGQAAGVYHLVVRSADYSASQKLIRQ